MPLSNDGILILNPLPHRENEVIVVTGVGRSGTSMVARVLQAAGLHMGDDMDDVVFEDRQMAAHIDSGNPEELREAIEHRSRVRARWGFKKPGLHSNACWDGSRVPNLRMVIIVRDPVALGLRAAKADQKPPSEAIREAVQWMTAETEFAFAQTCPLMLISYEKAITKPARFLEGLFKFTGVTDFTGMQAPDPLHYVRLIEPERPDYVQQARRYG